MAVSHVTIQPKYIMKDVQIIVSKNVINILAGVASVREELHCASEFIAQQLVKVRLSTCLWMEIIWLFIWLTGMRTKSIRVTSLCLTTAE